MVAKWAVIGGGVLMLILCIVNAIALIYVLNFADGKANLAKLAESQRAQAQQTADTNKALRVTAKQLQAQLVLAKSSLTLANNLSQKRKERSVSRQRATNRVLHEPDNKDWANEPVPDSVRRLLAAEASSAPAAYHSVATPAASVRVEDPRSKDKR